MDHNTVRKLRRGKWLTLAAGVLIITLLEAAYAFQTAAALDRLPYWLVEIITVSGLVLYSFRHGGKTERQLNQFVEDSRSQARLQATLIQLGLQLSTAHSESELCQQAVNEVRQAMGYERLELALADRSLGSRRVYTSFASDSPARGPARPAEADRPGVEIALRSEDKTIGSLRVFSPASRISDGEYSMLATAANQVSLAIVNARLLENQRRLQASTAHREADLQRSERSLQLFSEITQAGLSAPDLTVMVQSLTDLIGRLFEADGALIFLVDESRHRIRLAGVFGSLQRPGFSLSLTAFDLPLIETILFNGAPLAVPDAENSPHILQRTAEMLRANSVLALPLIAHTLKLGIALLTYEQQHGFNDDEMALARQAGGQIALAIARTRSLEEAHNLANELGALQKATSVLLTTLDLEKLLGQILDAAISAIPQAERGALHLVARDTGQLQLRAVQGYSDPRIRVFSPTTNASYTTRAVRQRKPILVEDAVNDPAAQPSGEPRVVGSAIIAPLLMGESVLGAVALDSRHRSAFSMAELRLLVSFAATATTAISNAQLHAEVQKQAITDTLTGLYNRRGFDELGCREVERAIRFGRPLTAMMLDIDFFKQINDLHGHLVGDHVLSSIAVRCNQELRQIDLLGRFGGDEFIALLPETDLESARQVAERLRESISQVVFSAGAMTVKITLSVGLASLSPEIKDLDGLVQKADKALYDAKRSGRNRVSPPANPRG